MNEHFDGIRDSLFIKNDKELKEIISAATVAYEEFNSINIQRERNNNTPIVANDTLIDQQDKACVARHLLNDRRDEREAYKDDMAVKYTAMPH